MDFKIKIQRLTQLIQRVKGLSHYENKLKQLSEYADGPIRILITGDDVAHRTKIISDLLKLNDSSILQQNKALTFIRKGKTNHIVFHYVNGKRLEVALNETAQTMARVSQMMMEIQSVELLLDHPLLDNLVLVMAPQLGAVERHYLQYIDEVLYFYEPTEKPSIVDQPVLQELNETGLIPVAVIPATKSEDLGQRIYDALRPHIALVISEQKQSLQTVMNQLAQDKTARDFNINRNLHRLLSELYEAIKIMVQQFEYKRLVEVSEENYTKLLMNFTEQENLVFNKLEGLNAEIYTLIHTMENPKSFVEWFHDANGKITAVPLADWKKDVQSFQETTKKRNHVNAKIRDYNVTAESTLGSAFNFFWRFELSSSNIRKIKEQFKDVKKQRAQLLIQMQQNADAFTQMNHQLKENESQIKQQYEQLLQQKHKKQRASTKRLMLMQEEFHQAVDLLLEQVQEWDVLYEIEAELDQLDRQFHLRLLLKQQVYPHTEVVEKIAHDVKEREKTLEQVTPALVNAAQWNAQFMMPKTFMELNRPRRYWFTNYRFYLSGVATTALLLGGYYGVNALKNYDFFSERDEPIDAQAETEHVQEESEYLSYSPSYNNRYAHQMFGTLQIYEEMPVYASYNGAVTDLLVPDNSSWEVYEIMGDWYRIQKDYWLYVSAYTDAHFESNVFVPNTETSQYLGNVYVANEGITIYDKPKGKIRPQQLASDTSYEVSIMTESGWLKIGTDAWILYDDTMTLEQPELTARLGTHFEPIQQARAKTDFIPVFNKSDRLGDIIGYLFNYDNVPIYETIDDEWVEVGENAWVEAKKYLEIDWNYYGYNELSSRIGSVEIITNTLNVRTTPLKESSLRGVLKKGQYVDVYEVDPETGWYLIGEDAWISNKSELVRYEEEAVVYEDTYEEVYPSDGEIAATHYIQIIREGVNVYPDPYGEQPSLGEIQSGNYYIVQEITTDGQWLRIAEGAWIINDPFYVEMYEN